MGKATESLITMQCKENLRLLKKRAKIVSVPYVSFINGKLFNQLELRFISLEIKPVVAHSK